MPKRHTLRFAFVVLLFLSFSDSVFAQNVFLKIPGVTGISTAARREGWSDVQSHTLSLTTATTDEKKKTLVSQCSAAVDATLGAAAARTVELIGVPLAGDVLIEVESNIGVTFYQAALKGAVITRYTTTQAGGFHDSLWLTFNQVMLSIKTQRPDGTYEAAQVGTFDCLRAP